jgi:hypothetical protein
MLEKSLHSGVDGDEEEDEERDSLLMRDMEAGKELKPNSEAAVLRCVRHAHLCIFAQIHTHTHTIYLYTERSKRDVLVVFEVMCCSWLEIFE